MDFADSPEHAAFRAEFRHWLAANLPAQICVDDAADQRVAPDRETLGKRIAWQKTMHAAGWVGISWPKEYGGRGAGFMQQVIFEEEYFRARAPVLPTASALPIGANAHSLGNRRAEEAAPAAHPQRRRAVVPGLFGARCRR